MRAVRARLLWRLKSQIYLGWLDIVLRSMYVGGAALTGAFLARMMLESY